MSSLHLNKKFNTRVISDSNVHKLFTITCYLIVCTYISILSTITISLIEPIGTVKPRVTSKTIELKEIASNTTFAGVCSGQGYPVPIYR